MDVPASMLITATKLFPLRVNEHNELFLNTEVNHFHVWYIIWNFTCFLSWLGDMDHMIVVVVKKKKKKSWFFHGLN